MNDDELFDELNGPITEDIPADSLSPEDLLSDDPWGNFKAMMYGIYLCDHLKGAIIKLKNPYTYDDVFKLSGLAQDHYESAKYYFQESIDEVEQEAADDFAEQELLKDVQEEDLADDLLPFDSQYEGSDLQDGIEENGGIIIHADIKEQTYIVYYAGQWNDAGFDPDDITIFCDPGTPEEHRVNLYEDKVYLHTPTKDFDMPLKLSIKDFVRFHSPIDVVVNKTHIPDLVDAISDKKITVIFDKEIFRNKIERLRNLLVFS